MNATTNEPTGATYRIETLSDILAIPPRRMGYLITDLAMWIATAQSVRDSLADAGGTLEMPTGMDWRDDGKHIGGVKVNDATTGATLMELKLDGALLGAAPVKMPTPTPPTAPAPLSARLATMAEQVSGLATVISEANNPTTHELASELQSLAGALDEASADAEKLEAVLSAADLAVQTYGTVKAGRAMEHLASAVIDWRDTTTQDHEPDRDTDQAGNTWRNADGDNDCPNSPSGAHDYVTKAKTGACECDTCGKAHPDERADGEG